MGFRGRLAFEDSSNHNTCSGCYIQILGMRVSTLSGTQISLRILTPFPSVKNCFLGERMGDEELDNMILKCI